MLLTVVLLSGAGFSKTYTTNFPSTENPISEGGNWANGKSVGLDWQNVRTTPGFAFLTQGNPSAYDDNTAILTGTWGANQYVRTVVRIPALDQSNHQEIEIRLRSSVSAHWCSGYEVLCGFEIIRWNGAFGSFTALSDEGPHAEVHDGDIFEASMIGNVITVYINGAKVNRAVDNTFATGNPGMGFFTRNSSPQPFGFSSFTATDSLGTAKEVRPSGTPGAFSLSQNFPNPFRSRTALRYVLNAQGPVTLNVYDLLGRESASLVNKTQPAGAYNVNLESRVLKSGVYTARLTAGNQVRSCRMLLLK